MGSIEIIKGRRATSFNCEIQFGKKCGFGDGGHVAVLVNTDSVNAYNVTIRTTWKGNGQSGAQDDTYKIAAGMRKELGCTTSNRIPKIEREYSVVGERVIK